MGRGNCPGDTGGQCRRERRPHRLEARDTAQPERAAPGVRIGFLRAPHGWIERLTGAELAVTLADIDLSPTELAWLYGTSQDRVLKWLDGEDAVPHPVRLILAALAANPGLLPLWRQVTSMVTEERRRPDNERRDNGA